MPIHDDAVLVDTHCDTIGRILDEKKDIGQRLTDGHMDLPRLREGGVDVQFFACWVDPKLPPDSYARRVFDMLEAFRQWSRRYTSELEITTHPTQVRSCLRAGKIAAVPCVEGGHAIQDDLSILRKFHALGVRYLTLTWMNNNNWADGSGDSPKHHGLTPFGREVVREMNRIGMIVDVSHVSEETFWHTLETSSKPILASHSSCKVLCDHHRNLTDRQLRAMKDNGGVVCINFYSSYLSDEFRKAKEPVDKEQDKEMNLLRDLYSGDPARLTRELKECEARYKKLWPPSPPLDLLIDHIDHAVKIAGIDHVGLGSDFDGVSSLPQELTDCSALPLITGRLVQRGYTPPDVKKILGENVLRLMEQTLTA